MRIPVIQGIIDRRILANFRIDAAVMARNRPAPFRPKLASGYAIGAYDAAPVAVQRVVWRNPRLSPNPT